jgi:uncharacterized protein YbcI
MLGVLGKSPKTINCHIFNEMVYIRSCIEYTRSEKSLILSENGCNLLKDYRHNTILSAIDTFKEISIDTFNIKLVNFHHDITPINGEEILVFTLESIPELS